MKRILRVLILLCLIATPSLVHATLTASFATADNRSSCGGLVCTFTPTITGCSGSYSLQWYYINTITMDTAYGPNVHAFTALGCYDVTLRVACGPDTIYVTNPAYVCINPQPVVNFVTDSPAVDTILHCSPHTVHFINTTAGDTTCPNHQWQWIVTGPSIYLDSTTDITYTFTLPGDYTVRLIYGSPCACHGILERISYIHIDSPATACFTRTDANVFCSAPAVGATFSAGCSSHATTFSWSVDGGPLTPASTSTTYSPTFTTIGNHTVTMTAYSAAGCAVAASSSVVIHVGNFAANFLPSIDTICQGGTATFRDSSYIDAATPISGTFYTIDPFGSMSPGYPGQLVAITFVNPGLWTVIDSPANAYGCRAGARHYIYVRPAPVLTGFIADTLYKCSPNIAAHFHALPGPGFSAYTYRWAFSSSATATFTGTGVAGANPAYTYTTSGYFSPTLTVSDVHSCSTSVTLPNYIYIGAPNVTISASSDSGCASATGLHVDYHVGISSVPVGTPFTVDSLYYTDSTTSSFTHALGCISCTDTGRFYTTPGPKWAYVRWHLPPYLGGCSGLDSVRILMGASFTPNITLSDTAVCPFTTVTFDSHCDTCYTSQLWTIRAGPGGLLPGVFTDDTSFTSVYFTIPNIGYPAFGSHWPIRWTGTRNGCTVVIDTYVHVLPPMIFPNSLSAFTPNCRNRDSFSFVLSGPIGVAGVPITYQWSFGDGGTLTTTGLAAATAFAAHEYTVVGPGIHTFTVIVKAIDSTPGHPVACYNTDTLVVSYGTGPLPWTIDNTETALLWDTVGCKNDVFRFAGPPQPDGNQYYQYIWTFGDGITIGGGSAASADSFIFHSYSLTGTYTVRLIVGNNYGCRDTAALKHVKITGPQGGFTVSGDSICVGSSLTFTDINTDTGSTIISRNWNFNTTGIVGGPPNVYTAGTITMTQAFNAEGNYIVALNDTDANHCSSHDVKTVHVIRPHAYFTSPDVTSSLCIGVPVSFHDTNTHCTYTWNFGDGPSTTGGANVTHTYTANGSYTVTVIIVADGTGIYPAGCTDTFRRPNYVVIAPIPGIAITDYGDVGSVGCPPLHLGVGPTYTLASLLGGYTYEWNVTLGTGTGLGHYYTDFVFTDLSGTGPHRVWLIATTPLGCRDSVYEDYFVGGPSGYLTVTADSGCAPFALTMTYHDTGVLAASSNFIWYSCPEGTFTSTDTTHSYLITTPGTYCPPSVIINNGSCVVTIDNLIDSIYVFPKPDVSVTHITRMCYGATASLTASSDIPVTYAWAPSAGLACSTCATISPNSFTTTTYTVTGTTVHGCVDTAISTVTVDSPIVITITGRDSICIGERDTLTAHSAAGSFYSWSGDAGVSGVVGQSVVIITNTTNTYWVHVLNASGCEDSASFTVTVMPAPVLAFTPNPAFVCDGDSTQLQMTGAAKYIWTPRLGLSCDSCSNPKTGIGSNIIYSVTGISSFGCKAKLNVPVTVYYHLPSAVRSDTVICNGDHAQLWAKGGATYLWKPNKTLSDSTSYAPIATPTVTTVYTVYIKENPCFVDTHTVKVTVIPIPILRVPPTITIIAGNSVQLYADTLNHVFLTSYAWTPADSTLTCSDCPRPIATPVVTTTYSVSASTIEGCTGHATVTIKLLCETSQVFIPNTFTPNGDGVNDRFYVSGKGLGMITRMAVYNRWGEMVYEGNNIRPNDPGYGWDGTFRGEVVAPDVFVYVLEVLCSTGEPFTFRGDISLVR